LRASEAKEATLLGGFRDLLGHGDQPLLETLDLVRLRLLRDQRDRLSTAFDRKALDLLRRLACNSAGADCSRAPLSRSVTRAFTNSLAAPRVLTSASILPTANISLITPNGPLGLAATTAMPAMKGARWICFHSSAEKSAFVAIVPS
jgi:hypothetical protein